MSYLERGEGRGCATRLSVIQQQQQKAHEAGAQAADEQRRQLSPTQRVFLDSIFGIPVQIQPRTMFMHIVLVCSYLG